MSTMSKKMDDSYRHKGLRTKLIEGIREKGITDENVLTAMNNIPRHFFLDVALDNIAYEDRAFPIGEGQTISQPYTVAYQTQLLKVKPGLRILEVGTGSSYQATVLAEMGALVFTIERQKNLYKARTESPLFKEYLSKKYPNIKFFFGDGFLGLPTYAPFDRIIITAGAPFIPPALLDQLKPDGYMVIPVNEDGRQRMLRVSKRADGGTLEEAYDHFSFVPMLSGKAGG